MPPTLVLAASWEAWSPCHALDAAPFSWQNVSGIPVAVCLPVPHRAVSFIMGDRSSCEGWSFGALSSWLSRLTAESESTIWWSLKPNSDMYRVKTLRTYVRMCQSEGSRLDLWVMWIRRGLEVSGQSGIDWQLCPECQAVCHPPLPQMPDDSMYKPCLILWPAPRRDELMKLYIQLSTNPTNSPQKGSWCDMLSGSMLGNVSPHSVIKRRRTMSPKQGAGVYSSA